MRDSVLLVQPEQVNSVWSIVEPYLARVESYRLNTSHLYQWLINGQQQLWLCLSDQKIVGACVTAFIDYPMARVLEVSTLGGDGGNWNEMMLDVEQYAKSCGCSRIEIVGRKGWLRALEGYAPIQTTISKEL